MTAQHPAVPESEPGARGLREAVEALADTFHARIRQCRAQVKGKTPLDKMNGREANTWDVAEYDLRALLAEHTPEATESERHVVHVTAKPIAEDVVWCEECEEWVTPGQPEGHTPEGDPTAGERECPEDDLPCSECPDYCLSTYAAPAEPDAGDEEALAKVLADLPTDPVRYARLILASDWFSATADRARREGARVVCTNCDADDLGCTACGAHGTLSIARSTP